MTNTLGWRRLVGWIAAIGAGLVVYGYLTGAEWVAMVVRLVIGA